MKRRIKFTQTYKIVIIVLVILSFILMTSIDKGVVVYDEIEGSGRIYKGVGEELALPLSNQNIGIFDDKKQIFVDPIWCGITVTHRVDYKELIRDTDGKRVVTQGLYCDVGERVVMQKCDGPSSNPGNCERLFDHDYLLKFYTDRLDLRVECEGHCWNQQWFLDEISNKYIGYNCIRCPAEYTNVCTNGVKRAVSDIYKYEECDRNTWQLKSCPSNTFFSEGLQGCVELTGPVTCEFGECSSVELHTCDGDYRLSDCNYINSLNKWCWINREYCEYGCTNGVCNSAPICQEGSKRAVSDIYKYEECVNNAWVLRSCPSNTFFSEGLQGCVELTGPVTCEFGECSSVELHTCDGDYRLSDCNYISSLNKWCWINREYCVHGCENGVCIIVTDTCTYSAWSPLRSTITSGQTFTQTRTVTSGTNCVGALSRTATGTKDEPTPPTEPDDPDDPLVCQYSAWTPLHSTKAPGEEFTQTRTITKGTPEECTADLVRVVRGTGEGHCLALLQKELDDGTCAISELSIGLIIFFLVLILLKVMNKK
jgi:hypothetical protein